MNPFLIQDSSFYLLLSVVALVCVSCLHIYGEKRKKQTAHTMRTVESVKDVCHSLTFKPNQPMVLAACKKCGEYAILRGKKTQCLNTTCEHKTLHA